MPFMADAVRRVRGERRAVAVIGALAAIAGALGVSLCPFATLTGLPCPGCGLLRATLALVRGHWSESFRIHPLALVALPLGALAMLRLRSNRPPSRAAGALLTSSLAALVVAMVVVWVARQEGALGGPVSVHSIWSATGTPSPFSSAR